MPRKEQSESGAAAWRAIKADREKKGIKQLVILLQPGDVELLSFVQETLGVNKGEALRTSLRVYSAILAQMKQQP